MLAQRNRGRLWNIFALVAGVSLWIPTFQVSAQATGAADPHAVNAAVPASDELAQVVVTAEKHSENLQKAPAAVTVVTGDQLVAARIQDERALETIVPSANFSVERQNTVAYLRGVGTANDYPNSDPSVVMQVNQVYTPRSATAGALYDIQSVEILPGPQGTLYGRNAIGGVINVSTVLPGDTFSGEALIEGGNYSLTHEFAALNMPLTDDFKLRLAVNREQHSGYLSNGFDDEDSTAFRLSALYNPGALSALLTYSYYHNAGVGDASVQIPYVKPSDPWYFPSDPSSRDAFSQRDIYQLSGTIDYKLADGITLSYIPGWVYVRINQNNAQNVDVATANTIYSFEPLTQYSQEFRVSGEDGPVRWVGGLYWYWGNTQSAYDLVFPGIEGVGPFSNVYIPATNREESYAAFSQITYSVTDTFRLEGGLRYSSDLKRADGATTVTLYPPAVPETTPLPTSYYDFDHTWHNVDWKVGAQFDLTDTSMMYANVGSGYLEGGYSLVPSTPTFNNIYQPEKLIAYTVGVKNRFFDNRLEVNDELFYYDYREYQVSYYNITYGTSVNYNAKKAAIYGNDLSLKFLISPNDSFDLGAGLLEAHAIDFQIPTGEDGAAPISFNGYRLPDSPVATVTAGLQHKWEFANASSLTGRVQTHYDSGEWETFNHLANTYQGATTKTDVTLTYTFADDKWNVGAWGKNLENAARFAAPGTTAVPGINSAFLEPPRTYGVRIGAKF
jgi:iron complex outermembrane receptor protein